MTASLSLSPLAETLLARLPLPTRLQVQTAFARFTPEQLAVMNAVMTTGDNLVVESTAGSGKSTLLKTMAVVLPRRRPIGAFAFNGSISEEIREVMPEDVICSTLHAHGRSLLEAHRGRIDLVPYKRRNLAQAYLAELGLGEPKVLRNLTRLLELTLIHLAAPDELPGLISAHGLSFPDGFDAPAAIRTVQAGALQAYRDKGQIDYTDMLYLPIKLKCGAGSLGVQLIDEAQDLTRLQHRLVKHLAGETGRVILVGDSEQAIYGFSGADVQGLERAEALFGARRLRLTFTWRCPKQHVALARQYSNHIQAPASAAEGEVQRVTEDDVPALTQPGDLIVCRSNGPLVQLALRLAESGQAVKILGHDLDKDLTRHLTDTFRTPFHAADIEERLTARGEHLMRAHARTGLSGAQLRRVVERDTDQLACCAALAVRAAQEAQGEGRAATAAEVVALAKSLMGRADGAVRLCTVHKSKGLEARRVIILHPEALMASGGDEREERAVCFVAHTRARETLILAARG
ncbi:UvrD-helicase domain-containing protein [Deinococcus multiflagellatus]|uniref:DNA 3'-5' helicase n=1 Tax=Deinococcus multiflagellatus TaxID=1656887 RepID=A0ABW1ZSH1_9DEIO|nr:UvrD-helicase domain-containing protein [Deinococcus multiflagellatus]MBZ9715769.1 UvrD-helicase domain-containing protein [Deinococcus multiflagellatus]